MDPGYHAVLLCCLAQKLRELWELRCFSGVINSSWPRWEWMRTQAASFLFCLPVAVGGIFTDLSGMGLLFWNGKFKWKIAVRCCQRALLTGERSHTIWQVKGISFIPDLPIYHKADCSFQWLHWLNFRTFWGGDKGLPHLHPRMGVIIQMACHYAWQHPRVLRSWWGASGQRVVKICSPGVWEIGLGWQRCNCRAGPCCVSLSSFWSEK